MRAPELKEFTKLPRHIAIVMDGNGRWAKAQGKNRIFGHQNGVETARKIVEISAKTGIEYLSLFAFSMENWTRPANEVNALMELLIMGIERDLPELHRQNIRLKTAGDISKLPEKCIDSIQHSTDKTSANTGMLLCIALSYSGKWDIAQAAQKMAKLYKQGKINENDFTEKNISAFLSTADMPDPELMIRTGGEFRISNYYLWQSAYTELYFTCKNWPDFGEQDFYDALRFYQTRERRFGKISEQLK